MTEGVCHVRGWLRRLVDTCTGAHWRERSDEGQRSVFAGRCPPQCLQVGAQSGGSGSEPAVRCRQTADGVGWQLLTNVGVNDRRGWGAAPSFATARPPRAKARRSSRGSRRVSGLAASAGVAQAEAPFRARRAGTGCALRTETFVNSCSGHRITSRVARGRSSESSGARRRADRRRRFGRRWRERHVGVRGRGSG